MAKLFNFYDYESFDFLHNYNGIQNIGNTCYMNTILQCLRNNLDLSNYFLTKSFKDELLQKPHSLFTVAFYHLLTNIWKIEDRKKKNLVVNPIEFFKQFQKTSQKLNRNVFLGFRQNDAEEFLLFVLDTIHESLQYKDITLNITGNCENTIDTVQKKFYEYIKSYLEMDGISIIKSLFLGFQISTITNSYNDYNSHNFEPMLYINLEIPDNSDSIYDCLNHYCKSDVLNEYKDTDNDFPDDTVYQKHSRFILLPKYLIIVFKRFKQHNNYLVKNTNLIQFPFKLDMNKYTYGYINHNEYIYDLQSIAYHTGNLNGGHYFAVSKFKNKWRMFNDQTTGYINDEKQLINPNAYILFYKKK